MSNKIAYRGGDAVGLVLNVMLPESQDSPTLRLESIVDDRISMPILLEFQIPEFGVGFGSDPVFGARVPLATINEDDKSRSCEDNIGPASQGRSNPIASTDGPEGLAQLNLRLGVAPLYAGHAVAASLWCQHIGCGCRCAPSIIHLGQLPLALVE